MKKLNKILPLVAFFAAFLLTDKSSTAQCTLSLLATPVNASCSNACDASVILTPSGGTAPYSFNAFDHTFPGSGVNLSLFDVRNGNFSVSGNQLTAKPNTAVANDYDNSIATKTAFPDNGKIVVEGSFFIDYNTYGNFGLAEDDIIFDQYQLPYSFFFSYGTLYLQNEGNLIQLMNYSSSTWYDLKIEKLGNTVNYYLRSTGLAAYNLVGTAPATYTNPQYKVAAIYNNFLNFYGGFKTTNWRVGGNPPMSGLCPGTYSYTVFDANGCFASASVTVGVTTGPGSLTLNGSATSASCATAADGTTSLLPSGGTGPYSYGFAHGFQGGEINQILLELRNGNFSQGSDLREGTNYTTNNSWDNSVSTRRTFSDGGYLVFEGSFKFDANADVIFGFTNTGTIDDYNDMLMGFRVSNGTQLYAYTNNGGLITLPSITPDTWYDFKIEKTGNSLKFYNRLTGSGSYVLRHSRTYSSARVEFKAATLNFANFFSSNGGYNTKGWAVESVPKTTSLTPGTYTYTITDANGCTATKILNVIADIANVVSLNAALVSGACGTSANGAVALTPVAGKPPYSYAFTQNFSGNMIQSGLFEIRNGYFVQDGGFLRGEVIPSNTQWDNSVSTYYTFTDAAKLSFEGSFKFDPAANVYLGFLSNTAVINDPATVQIGYFINGTQLFVRAGGSNISMGSITSNTWYDLKIEKQENVVWFYSRVNGSGSYNLLTAIPYSGTQTVFRFGSLMYGANNAYGGFNTKDWVINDNPPTANLAAGTYTYKVYDAPGCSASATVVVSSNSNFAVNAVPSNSSAWNVCNGTVGITSNSGGNLSYTSKLYANAFSGTVFNTADFILRNGSFSQNNALAQANVLNNSGWDNSIKTNRSFTDNGKLIVEMEMQFATATQLYFGFADPNNVLNSSNAMVHAFKYAGGSLYAYNAGSSDVFIGNVSANQWNSFKIEKAGNTIKFYIRPVQDNQYQLLYTATVSGTPGSCNAGIINFFSNTAGDRSYKSRNWKVYNDALTSGLCMGNYTYAVTEASGCTAEVNFTVGTNLALVQTMTAPASVTVNTNAHVAYATGVALGSPTFGATPTGITITNNAPAQFPLGNTTLTWRAVDANGLVVTGTQTVTVVDNEPPTITAPPAVNAQVYIGQTGVSVNLGNAVANDNVPAGLMVTNNAPAQFPAGTTVVTWTARDAAGNTATATQNVIVVSIGLPTVTAPANVVTNTDAGRSYASNVSLGNPSLSVPLLGLVISNNAPAHFPLGTTTVTWTVSLLTLSTTVTQTVTVTDNESPNLNVPADVTVNTNTGRSYASNFAIGNATATDNATAVTITNDNTLTEFPIGITTIMWTATDAAGNVSTKKQSIIVVDNQAPSVTAPANLTVNTDAGQPHATNVALGTATTNDNSGGAILLTNDAPVKFPVGTTVVTWKAVDQSNNISTATQTVTVIDNERPAITAPANITIAVQQGSTGVNGPVALGTPVFSDNVPTGLTLVNNAPSHYPVGVTTITWTVTDAAGNSTTATQTVTVEETICPPVTASVTSSSDACGIKLIATGGATYQWSFGGNAVSGSSQIILGESAAAGIYTVTVNNTCGNVSTAAYDYAGGAGSASSNSNTNTIIGLRSVRLGENNAVENGGVAVTASNGEAAFKKNSSVDGQVRAKYISVQNPVVIPNKVYSAASVTLPAMQYYSGNCNNYSNYTVNNNTTVTLNNNYRDLYVKKGAVVTLGGTIFRTVTVEEGATVRFTSATLNIESLYVGKGLSGGAATVRFANNTSVRISTQVKVESGNIVNPDANKVTIYLGDNNCDEEKFLVKGDGAKVTADVYIPNGKIMVQSNCGHGYGCSDDNSSNSWIDYLLGLLYGTSNSNNSSNSSSNCATTIMTGTFIGEYVESGSNVTWKGPGSGNTCSTLAVTDNVAPAISCPPAQQFCKSQNGTYTVPAATATDNSGVAVTLSYTMSGATTRSGSGSNASGSFGTGTTTITFTAEDINGNKSTCITTVKVNAAPDANISSATSDVFCGELILTAGCSTSGVTYKWLYNNAVVGVGSTFTLDNGSAEGTYTLSVTDAAGCTNTSADTYTYSYQNKLSSYTIYGIQKVSLNESNSVQTGSVGVMSYCGKADFKKNSSVAGPGAFVKAKDIDVQNSSVNIPNKIYAAAVVSLPAMQVYNGSYGYNDYSVSQYATVTLTGNYRTLTIGKGATVTLNGSTFRKITINEGAKVTFTNTTLNIEDLYVSKGPGNNYTKVHFANNTSVRVSKQVKIDDNCQVNPDGKKVVFYLGDTQCDEEKFYVKGSRTSVTANVYAPTGKIKVTGGTVTQTYMTGIFIAEEIESEAKGVIWNGYTCGAARSGFAMGEQLITKQAEATEGIKVTAAPNPSTSYFTLQLKTSNTELVNIRVIDISGRLVEVITNQEPSTIFKLGQKWMNGVYMAEVMQGNQKQTVRLVKAN